MGWNYWYNWTIVLPAELNAAAVLISYWDKSTNAGVWIAVCLVVACAINFGGSRAYGEAEFWFAIIKVLTIIGLIILGIVLDVGGGPNGEYIGTKYWRSPGAFVQYLGIEGATGRFLGVWAGQSLLSSSPGSRAAAEPFSSRPRLFGARARAALSKKTTFSSWTSSC